MSDESSVQASATQVLGEVSRPRQLIRVDKAEFTKLLHQVLASKTLFQYIQTVSGENKRLKQQNDELRKIAHRTQRTVDEIVLADSKVQGHARVPDSGSTSLPSYFDFETQTTDYLGDGRYASLTDQRTPQSLGYFSKSPKSLLQSLYVSEPSLTHGNIDLQERGLKISQFEEKEKSDPCKDEETGLSLKIDGDVRSMQFIPQFHHQVGKNSSPSTSPIPRVSPNPSLTSGFEDQESVSSDNQSEQSGTVMIQGVSKQYFDVVVKELAKSKQLIKQLLAKNRESPKEVLDTVYLKEMVKSLEEENQRLKESNQYFRTLLVTEATSEDQRSLTNNEILNYHDKVQKLERQVELKDQALEQLNRQNEVWRQHGEQKTSSTQFTYSQEDQVFSTKMKDAETQTFLSDLHDESVQTEDAELHEESESSVSAMLKESQVRVRRLERMVGDLTTENQSFRGTVDLLTDQNRNLEMSYQQQLQTLKDLERNQDTAILQRDIKTLIHENEDMKTRLKENVDEMKFLRYQVQSAQSDQGQLSQKKTRVEAMLKSEQERNNQREAQLLTQYSKLQMRVERLEHENETLRLRVTSPQTNVARVRPVVQDPSKEPTSMPVTSHDFLWQKGGKDTGLSTDSDSKGHPKHFSNPCLSKLGQRSSEEEQFQCHHCLRNDFHDENSFYSHMQKCGD